MLLDMELPERRELLESPYYVKHHWNRKIHRDIASSHRCSYSRRIYEILLTLVTVSLFLTSSVHSLETDDSCNWTGSGLSVDSATNAIQQLSLHCEGGHISWAYPRNALHITLQLPERDIVAKDGHFRLCLNLKVRGNGANIYRDTPEKLVPLLLDDRPEFEKNTLGNEQHVHAIYERLQYERTSPKEEHCYEAKEGKAAIYIEAALNPLSLKYVTELDYRIEELPQLKQRFHHKRRECSRCRGGELIAAYCSSDFAVKSRMLAVTKEETTRETYIDVAVGRVYRQRDTIFLPGKHSRYYGVVATPTRCGDLQKLKGHYLMTGRIVLGRAELGCLAHMTEVKKIARDIAAAGVAPCDLSPLIGHHHKIIE